VSDAFHVTQPTVSTIEALKKRQSTDHNPHISSFFTPPPDCRRKRHCSFDLLIELRFLANVNSLLSPVRPSVCLSVCLSVTLMHLTQTADIFGNFLRRAVLWPSVDIHKKFTEIVPGKPLRRGS